MPLSQGQRLGAYEILNAIGAGGMGEVYRARDTKLNRDVAIKVLPDLFANDAERLARFTREAQTLASLNHPNIAQIHGLEESGGVRALVMELVDGEDLSAHIARGAIPLDEVVPIAKQIADALEAAHEAGIIHRDLKPANIKVRADGKVKVLDFGLAKALDPAGTSSADPANSPTIDIRATRMGTIIGTAAYMSPEQARGKAVDRRADVWAYGVVLYEMLTGRIAFVGETATDIIAAVVTREPDWTLVPASTPTSVRRLLRRCLEKDPRKRLSSIGDARLELDENEPATSAGDLRPVTAPRKAGWALSAGMVALAILATAGVMRLWPSGAVRSSVSGVPHLSIVLPDGDELGDPQFVSMALSPDGASMVYVGTRLGKKQLYLRKFSDPTPRALDGTDEARIPFFSPDGQWIGFFAQGKLKKIAVGGAALQVVCDAPDARGGSWGSDDNIYFAPTNISGIWRVNASGGAPTELTQLDRGNGEISHRWPQILPDHQTMLLSVWTGPGEDEQQIAVLNLKTGERNTLVRGGSNARYVADGYLLYSRPDALFALPWKPSQREMINAIPITLPVHPRRAREGAGAFDVSKDGTLVYLSSGTGRFMQRVVWVDRSGNTEAIDLPERDYQEITLSPDGQQAVLGMAEGTINLWLYDFSRRTFAPFATGAGSSQSAIWSPDGKRIVYRGTRQGTRNIYWKAADGTGDEERLTTKDSVIQTPTSISPDGRWLLFTDAGGETKSDIWMLRLDGDRSPQPFLRTNASETNARISPDGQWVAYVSDASGPSEVYVQSFPSQGPRRQISTAGGMEPLWSRDGRELFYQSGDKLMVVDVATAPTFSAGPPRVLFAGRYGISPTGITAYSQSADGRRFLRCQQVQPPQPLDSIDVVLNWFEQLRQAAAAR